MTEQNTKIHSDTASVALPTTARWPFAVISFLLLFTLSFQSIPLPIQAQIIPLTSVLALIFLVFTITSIKITSLLKVVALFAIFVLLHSVVALFIDIAVLESREIRVVAWARQIIALMAGVSVFLVLRKTLVYVSDRFIIRAVVAGALPALSVALLNVLWGITGNAFAGNVVTGIRSTLIPLGFTAPSRVSGLSLEPAHFAFYLAVVAIPVAFVGFMMLRKRLLWVFLLAASLIAFIWTVSTTGFIVFISLILAGMVFGPSRSFFTIVAAVMLIFAVSFLILHPPIFSYMIFQVESMLAGPNYWSVSVIDRFYSTFGPMMNALASYTLLGYGLGGTSIHFSEIIPAHAQAAIAGVRWEGMPNLNSLVGRLFAETGLIGTFLFIMIIFMSLREIKGMCRKSVSKPRTLFFLKIVGLTLFAFLVGSAMDHGSFALPYLWFWLAFIDSRYILRCAPKAEPPARLTTRPRVYPPPRTEEV